MVTHTVHCFKLQMCHTFLHFVTFSALPEEYQNIGPGKMFYDTGEDDPRRIKMWSTTRQCGLMQNAEHIYGDGTFRRPKMYCQHYIFYAEYMRKIFPCVHILMKFRKQGDYEVVIRKLMEWIVSCHLRGRKGYRVIGSTNT